MPLARVVLGSVFVSVLVGCTYTPKPKPQMTENLYLSFAYSWNAIHKCAAAGYMPPDTAALGIRYMESSLSKFSYTEYSLANALAKQKDVSLTLAECNTEAVSIHNMKQQIDIHNAAVDQRQAETQRILESTRPKQTQCNRIGTQVFCNTF